VARSKRERVQVGIDNRPGLKKIGQLDLQARQRNIRDARKREWKAVGAEIEALKYTAVSAGPGHTIMFGAMPEREQQRMAIAALNSRAAT